MTKKEALRQFNEAYPEDNGTIDWAARREAWNNYTDMLCKDGQITMFQYENWVHFGFSKS